MKFKEDIISKFEISVIVMLLFLLYVSFSPNKSTGQSEAVNAIQHCVKDVRNWMNNDKLLLNDDKAEFLMIGTKQQLAKVNIDHILIGDSAIRPKGG